MDEDERGSVVVKDEFQGEMKKVMRQYMRAKRDGTLLLLPFMTITEYMWNLREIAILMKPLGSGALFYLAAAVSDFFVPKDRMVEHKIQSSEEFNKAAVTANGHRVSSPTEENHAQTHNQLPAAHMQDKCLVIDLNPVPKFLKNLVDGWAPEGMIVSFKLETDSAILTSKSRHALQKYSHHLVIGNLLRTRKWEVVFVSALQGEKWIRVPLRMRKPSSSGLAELVGTAQREVLDSKETENSLVDDGAAEGEPKPIVEIESLIIPEIAKLHKEFVAEKLKS